jgi:uncharacterized protein (DUF433 family)
LIDYIEEGGKLDDFLEDFPTVSREHAVAVSKQYQRWAGHPRKTASF